MRSLILALLPVVLPTLLVACGDDTVAITDGSSTGADPTGSPTGDPTGSPTGDPTGSPTSAVTSDPTTGSSASASAGSDTTDPTATSTTTTTDPGTSTSGDTTLDPGTSTSGDTSSGSSGTTGEPVGCGMEGPEVEATLVHIGVDPGCGVVEFLGTNTGDSPGPVYELDGCPCGANCLQPDPWSFTLDVPKEWLPGKLPACPRIVVERQKSKQGCELVGVAIWDTQDDKATPARFHAGSLLGPIAAAQAELKTAEIVAEECDCDFCCGVPTRLDLEFAALGDSLTLAEGGQGTLANNEFGYDVKVFQSHLSGICDDSPRVDWVMRRF